LIADTSIGSSNRFIDCQIAYRFVIPAGAYVDMDSIPSLRDHRIANAYFDVEAPAHRSTDTPLYVCSKRALRKNFVFSEHFELPFRLRYHQPTGNEAIVKLSPPRLLVRCPNNTTFLSEKNCTKYIRKAPCDCLSDAKCDWVIISANELTPIEMSIPTGNPAIRSFVIFVTFAFIVVG
uniref:Phosphatidylinositol-glycan biosynthesis class X protein n=1 Tax=Toxocara canis TaxID=6265 RepID=A0A183VH30_TOXCA